MILLPHQVVAFPQTLVEKMVFPDQVTIIEELNGKALRYFFLYLKKIKIDFLIGSSFF